jgi:hypothetical protein
LGTNCWNSTQYIHRLDGRNGTNGYDLFTLNPAEADANWKPVSIPQVFPDYLLGFPSTNK